MSDPWVLGLAASHGGAACLMHGHRIVAAIQEERLTRVKYAPLVPARGFRALDYVLSSGGITAADLDLVVLCPLQSPAAPSNDLSRHSQLASRPRVSIPHHLGHAISAYAASGFEDATILVVDGMGSHVEDLTEAERSVVVGAGAREVTSIYSAKGSTIVPMEKHVATHPIPEPDDDPSPRMFPFVSLGTLYQTVAEQVFGSWHDSGKLMGLAAYGRERWPVSDFLRLGARGLTFVDHVPTRVRGSDRWPHRSDEYGDLAASAQAALEAGLEWFINRAATIAPNPRFCYAGGVALNVTANERLLYRSGRFADVFIQPAAEDAGTAIGAAQFGIWQLTGEHRPRPFADDFLGRRYGDVAANAAAQAADLLASDAIVGWFEGGAEFGPRALGHRSILANPITPATKARLDRIKRREPFRPYAPVALEERAGEWFDFGGTPTSSRFMLRALPFQHGRAREVPVAAHVDGTGRLQTVVRGSGSLHAIIDAFHARTGVPIVVNTSLNDRGCPIVETPDEALALAGAIGLDACFVDGRLHRLSST